MMIVPIPPLHWQGRGTSQGLVEGPREAPFKNGSLRSRPSTALRAVPFPSQSRGG